ncbi:MAG: ATP-binding cassette domain-containing protein [Planctomycetota bacterium]|nr:ATP-binding cassette domain-containing protein [Planctomycetota bacterium]
MGAHFQITDLQCMAGDFRLGPLSLEMERNDYLVLLGPTGCGKTTLVKCIVGAVRTEGGGFFWGDGR